MSSQTLSFEQWCAELDRIAREEFGLENGWIGVDLGGDPEAWRGYYDDEYSPRDALEEDMSYGD